MKRFKFSIRSLLLTTAICAVALFVYLNPSLRTTFMRMHRSSKRTTIFKLSSFFNTTDVNRPQLANGIDPVLLPVLEQLEESLPEELLEYLSTSVPKEEYHSYHWAFLPAKQMAEYNTDDGICSAANGYFIIAQTDYGFGAVSLKDGRFYVAHRFSKDDGFSPPDCEAESIADLLRKQTQDYFDLEW